MERQQEVIKMSTTARNNKLLKLVQFALFTAILIVLNLTGLGLVRTGVVAVTTLHIPVIIGAILLGPWAGAALGGVFGIISMMEATFRPSGPVDMLFSPALSGNPVGSVVMCILPRILIGLVAGLLFNAIQKMDKKQYVSIGVSAAAATFIHTLSVLLALFFFFSALAFKDIFAVIISVNFLIEFVSAVVLSIAVSKPVMAYLSKR